MYQQPAKYWNDVIERLENTHTCLRPPLAIVRKEIPLPECSAISQATRSDALLLCTCLQYLLLGGDLRLANGVLFASKIISLQSGRSMGNDTVDEGEIQLQNRLTFEL